MAPSFIAATASWMVPKAVITTTCTAGSGSLAARSTPKPSPAGSLRSVSTTAGRRLAQRLRRFGFVARLHDAVALRLERLAQHRRSESLSSTRRTGVRSARRARGRGQRSQPAGTPARRPSS